MLRPYDPLGEEQVADEEQDDAGVHEDHGDYAQSDALWVDRPHYPERVGHDAGEAETEHHAAERELLASPGVDLQERHMAYRATDEQEQEDGADGDIRQLRRRFSQRLLLRWVWRAMFFGDLAMPSVYALSVSTASHSLTCAGSG